MKFLISRSAFCAVIGSLITLATPVMAQTNYPSKPITWIVAYPPGGGSDFLARNVSVELGKRLGQNVVVENKPGAATIVGAQAAARAPADGYTVFTADNGSLIFNPALYSKLPYKATDFAALGVMARFPLLLVSSTTGGYSSTSAMIEAAKSNPKALRYASPGAGGPHHLAMELLKRRAGFEAEHIPYKGAAPAVQDLIGGQVPIMMLDTATALPQLKGGKIKALAVASAKRLPQLPDVPTFKELGIEGVEVSAWHGLVVPEATPLPIRETIAKALQGALSEPSLRKTLSDFGLEVVAGEPVQMTAYIESETKIWHRLIREIDLKLEN